VSPSRLLGASLATAAAGHDTSAASECPLVWTFVNGYNSYMKRASVSEAKNTLSALIHRVQEGASVLIVDRGRPVARLEPVQGLDALDDDRLARLVRQGVVRPARGALSKAVGTNPPRVRKGASGVRALLDERREGR
jgi:prevent-host-death family protein